MPLRAGVKWVYKGKVEWTQGSKEKSALVTWTTAVVATFKGQGSLVTVVRDYPGRLAWYEPGQPHRYDILVSAGNRLYRYRAETLGADNQSAAVALAQGMARGAVKTNESLDDLLFEFPLAIGKRWGGDPDRDDRMYCWTIDDAKSKTIHASGIRAGRRYPVYTMAYRTNPDHEFIDFAPGIGIIHFIYGHHGTVAAADVRLVALKVPTPKHHMTRMPATRKHTPAQLHGGG